jgi:hypothetical protein
MASLLNKLTNDGSLLSGLDGKKPLEYDRQTAQIAGLTKSQLDLDGKNPLEYNKQTVQIASLTKSQLDLDGKTPDKYLDNPPR